MAHYAFLDNNNVVVEVIVGRNEDEVVAGISNWEEYYGEKRGLVCKRTSYNGNIRTRFAGIGYTYSAAHDAFIEPQPFPSWTLNEVTTEWEPPIAKPNDDKSYLWDEVSQNWLEVGV